MSAFPVPAPSGLVDAVASLGGVAALAYVALLTAVWVSGRRAQAAATHRRRRPRFQRAVFLLAVAGAFILSLDYLVITGALAELNRTLGATQEQLVWIVDAYLVVYAALLGLAGLLTHRFGERRVLVWGLDLFLVGAVLGAVASEVGDLLPLSATEVLIGARGFQGVGAAAVITPALALILREFRQDRAGAVARWTAYGMLGVVVGPLFGAVLLELFGWQAILWALGALCLVVRVGAVATLPRERPHKGSVDWLGGLLSVAVFGVTIYLFVEAGHSPEPTTMLTLAAVDAASLIAFVWWELRLARRGKQPAFDLSLFRQRPFWGGSVFMALLWGVLMGAAVVLSIFFQIGRGHGPLQAGVLLMPLVTVFFGGLLAKRLAGRHGWLVALGFGLVATAVMIWSRFERDTEVWLILASFAIGGFGLGAALASVTQAMTSRLGDDQRAAGSALSRACGLQGGAIGVAGITLLISRFYEIDEHAVAGLPPASQGAARESIGDAAIVARELVERAEQSSGPEAGALAAQAARLLEAAVEAFIPAMSSALLVAALVAAVSAPLALWVLRRERPEPGLVQSATERARSILELRRRAAALGIERIRFTVPVCGREIDMIGYDRGGDKEVAIFAPGMFGDARHGETAALLAALRGHPAYSVGLPDDLRAHERAQVAWWLAFYLAEVIDWIAPDRRVLLGAHSAEAAAALRLAQGKLHLLRAKLAGVLLIEMPGFAIAARRRLEVATLGPGVVRLALETEAAGSTPGGVPPRDFGSLSRTVVKLLAQSRRSTRGWRGKLGTTEGLQGLATTIMLTRQLRAQPPKLGGWRVPTELVYFGTSGLLKGERSARRVREQGAPVHVVDGGSHNSWWGGPDAETVVDDLLAIARRSRVRRSWADLVTAPSGPRVAG